MNVLNKIKEIAIIALATLGVLFLILIFLPDSDDDKAEETAAAGTEASVEEDNENIEDTEEYEDTEESSEPDEDEMIRESEEDGDVIESAAVENEASEESREEESEKENSAGVNIPDSELSDFTISFRTTSLDGKKVTDDIFSDYDITVVYFWGTYCDSCKAEMDDYASFYKDLPDNVNLVGLVGDVYDGLDNNVKSANSILNNAGAEFMNLRTSDSLLDIATNIQVIPSSFLVDREGHLIGPLLEGANYKDTVKVLSKYLE